MNTLTTPEQINRFALACLRGALRLEAAGMKRKGMSAVKEAKQRGFTGRTAKELYVAVDAKLKELR